MVDKPFLFSKCPTVGEYLTCFTVQGLVAAWCMSGLFTCFLGRPVPSFDRDCSVSQDSRLSVQNWVSLRQTADSEESWLCYQVFLKLGGWNTNQCLHFSEPSVTTTWLWSTSPAPSISYFRCLPESIPDQFSSLPKRPLKILAVTLDN